MSQGCKNLRLALRVGLASLALLSLIAPRVSVAQDRSSGREAAVAAPLRGEIVTTADGRLPVLETNSIISATLCFAVGFGACLLVVHLMLPSLVRSQCVEIVREYLDLVRRESDIRVVVLDRQRHESFRKAHRASTPATPTTGKSTASAPTASAPTASAPTASAPTASESSFDSQQHLRVDRPTAPTVPTDSHSDKAPNSMLTQIYQQNLHLRDQLRKQSRSVQP